MEEIIYPELPPGYVYRKPGELWNGEPPTQPNDIDILATDKDLYGAALTAFVSWRYEAAMDAKGVQTRLRRGSRWNGSFASYGPFPTVQSALDYLVLRIILGEWGED